MRNINHAWKHHVLMRAVIIKLFHILFHISCIHFTLVRRQCQNFVAAKFNSPGFMHTYMTCPGCQNTFIRFKRGINDELISLRTSINKVNRGSRIPAGFANLLRCRFCKTIRSIPRCLFHICFAKCLQNLCVASFQIITCE